MKGVLICSNGRVWDIDVTHTVVGYGSAELRTAGRGPEEPLSEPRESCARLLGCTLFVGIDIDSLTTNRGKKPDECFRRE